LVAAHLDDHARTDLTVFLDLDERASRAFAVFEEEIAISEGDLSVLTGDTLLHDHDLVVRVASDTASLFV
jgi:hypothetical protein